MNDYAYKEHPVGSDGTPRTGRRISKANIDTKLATSREAYHRFPGTNCIVCVITLANGWSLVGHSACVDPANFDETLGRRIAREKAVNELWALEGYALANEPSPGEVGLRAPTMPNDPYAEGQAKRA